GDSTRVLPNAVAPPRPRQRPVRVQALRVREAVHANLERDSPAGPVIPAELGPVRVRVRVVLRLRRGLPQVRGSHDRVLSEATERQVHAWVDQTPLGLMHTFLLASSYGVGTPVHPAHRAVRST